MLEVLTSFGTGGSKSKPTVFMNLTILFQLRMLRSVECKNDLKQ